MALLASVIASACATSPPGERLRQSVIRSVQPVAIDQDLPLMLIGAELALQQGDLATAAKRHGAAALLSPDPQVAEKATRLALAVRDWPLARSSLARWRELAPASAGIGQSQAWIALAEGDAERAFVELDALARRTTDNGWRPIAQVLIGTQDKALALRLLERIATPERLGARDAHWIAMSQLALKLGDKGQAARLADAAVTRFKSADAYAWSAQLALDRGDRKLARTRYAAALARDPSSLRLRSGYAALLGDIGDNAGAARALAGGKQSDVTFGARAAYAARAKDDALLTALYREIKADPGARSGRRLVLLGQLAEILERPDEALDWYREVPAADEHWFDAGLRIIVLNDKKGDAAAARARLVEMRTVSGADPEQAGELFLLEAELLVQKTLRHEAMAVYSHGLEQLPDDPRLLYARAMLAIELDDLAAAERDLDRMIDADPDNAEALNALGYTLADRTSRTDEALALITKALALKPDEPAIIDSYGWVQYRLGHVEEAIKHLRSAYAKSPDTEIAAHLGEALWVHGERDEARKVWAEGREKDPENKVLVETIKRLAP